jgi:serine protease Do
MANKGYLMLGAGVVVGAVAMATVVNTPAIRSARAQTPSVQVRPIADLDGENLATLRALDKSFANLAEYIEPATVLIRSEGSSERQSDMFGRRMPEMSGSGSGVIFRPDGWIITNDHVVNGFQKVTVVLNDGREFPGKVTGAADSDIALVKIEAKDLPTVQFADSAKVRPGQFAIAVGSPFGLENSVTIGHVSAVGRATSIGDPRIGAGRRYADLIQTDASINMGNSGGPLLNVEGQVIGINTAIYSGMGTGSVGIGFAIPSNQARLIAETLIEKGKITRGYLGILPETLKEYRKKELNIDGGAVVADIPSDGPAAIAGIKKDDVILKVGDAPVRNEQELRNSMLQYAPGQTVKVEYLRGKEQRTAEVRIGTPPAQTAPERKPQQNPFVEEDMPKFFKDFKFPDLGNPPQSEKDDKSDVAPLREGKAKLGIIVETVSPHLRKQFHIPTNVEGAVVMSVEPGSVAERLGLKQGDVILQLGDKTIKSQADLGQAMENIKWGDSKTLKSARYGEGSTFVQERSVRFR